MPRKKRCEIKRPKLSLQQLLKDIPCHNCKKLCSEHEGTHFGELTCPGVFHFGVRTDVKDQRVWDEISYIEMDNLEVLDFYGRQ